MRREPHRHRNNPMSASTNDRIGTRLAEFRELIAEIGRKRPALLPRLAPALPLAKLEAFERRNEIRLPQEFRRFVTEFANGGDGPSFHGWPGFDPENPVMNDPQRWREPFIHPRIAEASARSEVESNVDWGAEALMEEHDRDALEEARQERIDARVREGARYGWIDIGDHGCGIFDLLVVTGDERGHIWWSDDSGNVFPLNAPDHTPERYPQEPAANSTARKRWEAELLAEANSYRSGFLDYYGQWFEYLRTRHLIR